MSKPGSATAPPPRANSSPPPCDMIPSSHARSRHAWHTHPHDGTMRFPPIDWASATSGQRRELDVHLRRAIARLLTLLVGPVTGPRLGHPGNDTCQAGKHLTQLRGDGVLLAGQVLDLAAGRLGRQLGLGAGLGELAVRLGARLVD